MPTIFADVETERGMISLIASHPLPPTSRERARARDGQLAMLAERARQSRHPVLLLGDLNTSPWGAPFRRLLRHSGLQDSSRGRGVQPTWPAWFFPLLIPLDHCLHSDQIRVLGKWIGPDVRSDHYPVVIEFTVDQSTNRKHSGQSLPTSGRGAKLVAPRPAFPVSVSRFSADL